MAHIIADRVKETTATTGTGSLTLAGAVTGHRAFSAVCVNTDTAYYTCELEAEWEVGLGTWGTGNILARTSILASSNAGAAVNFSAGTKNVFLTHPANALGALTGDITKANNSLATVLATVNANVGTFGSATQSPQFTVNGKGLITAAANLTVTPAYGSITGLPSAIDAIDGLTPAADKIAYYTGAASAALVDFTAAGRTIVGAADAAAQRTALALVPGTNVQAFDADLLTIAGLNATTDNFMVAVSSAWASRTVAQVKVTLAYGTAADKNTGTSGNTIPLLDGLNTWSGDQTTTASFIVSGAAGTNREYAFETSAVPRWTVAANNAAEGGANAGSNFVINSWDDAGVYIESPLAINRATGIVTLKQLALTTSLALTQGGTGAITALAARASLGMDQHTLTFIIDGGSVAITTGIKGELEVAFACTINRVTLLADQTGSIVVDIWKDTYANYPPTVGDTITAAAKPTISAGTKSQDATLTGWTVSVSAGDILRFNVDSITTLTRVTVALRVTR